MNKQVITLSDRAAERVMKIIAQAKVIGTYNTSIEPQPDCCSVFMPDHPTTCGKIKYLEADERLFPWEELMARALDSVETLDLDKSDDSG